MRDRTAEFGIFIGDTDEQGQGYGSEATKLMLDYAFTGLGLQNVMLRVWEYNVAGLRVYRKAGFREFGRRTRAHMMNANWWDYIYMQALADGFHSPVLKRFFHMPGACITIQSMQACEDVRLSVRARNPPSHWQQAANVHAEHGSTGARQTAFPPKTYPAPA